MTAAVTHEPADRRPVRATAPVRQRSRDALHQLAGRSINFALEPADQFTPDNGWTVDDLCRTLVPEPPGPPIDGGSFQTACDLLDRYEMADPALVRAVYYRDVPVADRDMILEGRFLFLRFTMPVRVGSVRDQSLTVHDRPVQVYGWNYRTLEGHLERGQMDWEVWKWLDTGHVEFRIHAFTSEGDIDNPVVRLGFVLFGRWTQQRFYRKVRERMDALVARRLGARPAGERPCVDVDAVAGATFGPEEEKDDPGAAASR